MTLALGEETMTKDDTKMGSIHCTRGSLEILLFGFGFTTHAAFSSD